LPAAKGDDFARCRAAGRRRGILPRLARRGSASSERRGRHRWVVERTLAWLARFRLAVRSERRVALHLTFTVLACSRICWRQLQQFC
jgi:hypothetical protein